MTALTTDKGVAIKIKKFQFCSVHPYKVHQKVALVTFYGRLFYVVAL